MEISFFAPRNYLGCIIRGKQIADWLGGKYKPTKDYENEACWAYSLSVWEPYYLELEKKW